MQLVPRQWKRGAELGRPWREKGCREGRMRGHWRPWGRGRGRPADRQRRNVSLERRGRGRQTGRSQTGRRMRERGQQKRTEVSRGGRTMRTPVGRPKWRRGGQGARRQRAWTAQGDRPGDQGGPRRGRQRVLWWLVQRGRRTAASLHHYQYHYYCHQSSSQHRWMPWLPRQSCGRATRAGSWLLPRGRWWQRVPRPAAASWRARVRGCWPWSRVQRRTRGRAGRGWPRQAGWWRAG